MGLAGTLFPGVLWAQAQAQGAAKITTEMIANAASVAGRGHRGRLQAHDARQLERACQGYEENLQLHIPNSRRARADF